MPGLNVSGVGIEFPFDPYPCQKDYMEKVVQCLQRGENGILESPTGTGKTLCLLCSSLAWLEVRKAQAQHEALANKLAVSGAGSEGDKSQLSGRGSQLEQKAGEWGGGAGGGGGTGFLQGSPKIIYASRTHSQLSQAIQEMKRTSYKHFKVSVLGSREQLCIHPQVLKEESNTAKVHMCRAKTTKRTCHFYNNIDSAKTNKDFSAKVMDIEDLVTLGKKHNCCPYYMAREMKAEADVIFLPYNYLLDPKSRKAHGVELQGNVVIFDEAHNLEKICEDSSSFDFTPFDLSTAIEELSQLGEKLYEKEENKDSSDFFGSSDGAEMAPDFELQDVLQIKGQLMSLEGELDKVEIRDKEKGQTKPGEYIFELLASVSISFTTKSAILGTLDKITAHLTNETTSAFGSKGAGVSKFADVLKIVFSRDPDEFAYTSSHQQSMAKHYKVHIQDYVPKNKKKAANVWSTKAEKTGRTLSYWCFSPGHAMEELKAHGIRCVLLTSGTLSPLSSFQAEMRIPFPIQLENPHVIEKHQVWIGTMCKGPDGTTLNSSYRTRFDPKYQASLGNAIVNFARIVPNGLLVFFPSYTVMSKCLESWQESGIYSRIEQYKPVFVEPKGKADFIEAMEGFYNKINDEALNGAIFVAVCRGKVSEGLDFADINGRAVVITGLPYPPRMDPKVVLKMEFLKEMRMKYRQGLDGEEWYKQQASRAVNQAIGRVIRHKEDYGAIILCDERFKHPAARAQLPSWIRPCVTNYEAFGQGMKNLNLFFKEAEVKMPAPRPTKRKSPGTAPQACHSASFMPTQTRAGMSSERASSITHHLPSLKPHTEEASLSKLKIEYEMSSSYRQEKVSATFGLLSALDSTAKTQSDEADDKIGNSQIPSYQLTLRKLEANKKQRKKIMIRGKVGFTDSAVKSSHLDKGEHYLAQVKKHLSGGNYNTFSSILKDYAKNSDFKKMVSCLAEIFTDEPQHHHLFRKFYQFVKSEHKKEFDGVCKGITGEGCGYKPEDSISKKRVASALGKESNIEKRRKIEPCAAHMSAVFDTKSTSKSSSTSGSSAHLNTTSHLKHSLGAALPSAGQNMNQITHKASTSGLSGHTSVSTKPPSIQSHFDKVNKENASCNQGTDDNGGDLPKEPRRSGDLNGSPDLFKDSSSEKSSSQSGDEAPRGRAKAGDGSQSRGNDSKTNAEGNQGINTKSGAEPQDVKVPCGVCKKVTTGPLLKSTCGHIFCFDCLKKTFQSSKSCPVCGVGMTRQNLSKYLQPSATDSQKR